MAQFDPSVPSIARVYDFFLGGKDNFAADRALAEEQIAFAPLIPVLARENRQFLARAVAWAANQRVAQVYNHSPEDFAAFFGSLELVPPGAVDARQWRAGWDGATSLRKREGHVMAAVARV